MTPTKNGEWTEKVLHSFGRGTDGVGPAGSLVFDAAGNLYGRTTWGPHGEGTVFELTPAKGGVWTEKVLHSFGDLPNGVLIIDAAGNLYRTTDLAGARGYVTVFWLNPKARGNAKEKAELKTQSALAAASSSQVRPSQCAS